MAIKKMPAALFAMELGEALARKDGYIMGATGQDPKKWAVNSHWFTQYTGAQREKALYWREHAQRVWDCNGLAEGLYKDYSGVNIDSKARYNYAQWCDPKGAGVIPPKYRWRARRCSGATAPRTSPTWPSSTSRWTPASPGATGT